VSVTPTRVAEGQAFAVTYRWHTGPGFKPLAADYFAFVHALDAEGRWCSQTTMPRPRRRRPGGRRRTTATRTSSSRRNTSPGRLTLRVGMYGDGGERLALPRTGSGPPGVRGRRPDRGLAARAAGPIRSEWSRPRVFLADAFRPARWLQKTSGTIWIENPRADALALARRPSGQRVCRHVAPLCGWTSAARPGRCPSRPAHAVLLRLRVPKGRLGPGRLVRAADGNATRGGGPAVRSWRRTLARSSSVGSL